MFQCKKCQGWKIRKQARCKAPCEQSKFVSINRFAKNDGKQQEEDQKEMDREEVYEIEGQDIQQDDGFFWEDTEETFDEIFQRHVKLSKCFLTEKEKEILRIPFDDVNYTSNDGSVNHFFLMFRL